MSYELQRKRRNRQALRDVKQEIRSHLIEGYHPFRATKDEKLVGSLTATQEAATERMVFHVMDEVVRHFGGASYNSKEHDTEVYLFCDWALTWLDRGGIWWVENTTRKFNAKYKEYVADM